MRLQQLQPETPFYIDDYMGEGNWDYSIIFALPLTPDQHSELEAYLASCQAIYDYLKAAKRIVIKININWDVEDVLIALDKDLKDMSTHTQSVLSTFPVLE